ncbi:hypothetical protein PMLGA01_120034000 [Plasmodium malariae]|uniref:Uncharacterized protein n=1 Tax=Plasmodium malariae TaxID=5858 RepID=A0A1C3L0W5_PLAMA|nr:hypothetical protein PMLGA01_120034000 [Plasmodium malariae]
MSNVLANVLKNTKFYLDKINFSLIFFPSLLIYNIPLKNIEIRNIYFEIEFIKRVINFFTKKKNKKIEKNPKKRLEKKKKICITSVILSLDLEDYETYNSYYSIYLRLIKGNVTNKLIYTICLKISVFFLKIILKYYYISIKKIDIKIYYNHKHRHSKNCNNGKNISRGKSSYDLIFKNINIVHDGYARRSNKENEKKKKKKKMDNTYAKV